MMRNVVTVGSALLALALACVIVLQEGAPWRIPDDRIYPSSAQMREQESALCQGTHMDGDVALGSGQGDARLITCSHDIGAPESIYVWGDSHARHLLAGLVSTYPERNIHILYFTSCLSESGRAGYVHAYQGREALSRKCMERNARASVFFEQTPPTRVILHQYFGYEDQFSPQWYAAAQDIIAQLEAAGHSVAFVGGVARPGVALGACLAVPASIPKAQLQRRCVGQDALSQMVLEKNAELSDALAANFVNPSDFFCPNASDCRATLGSVLLFRDAHHLTVEGSRRMIDHVKIRLSDVLGI